VTKTPTDGVYCLTPPSLSSVPSLTRTAGVRVAGPSIAAAENVAFCPGVSNVPLSSRSAYVSASPSSSVPDAASPTLPPSSTEYGPPELACGGLLSVNRTTFGSWSEA
jgi:hypothetical protein